jgi:hypothetical protein
MASLSSSQSAPQRGSKPNLLPRFVPSLRLLWIVAWCLLIAEIVFFLFFRRFNLDEGWYLWASKLVYEGKLLYTDFAYTQTPLLPYAYGVFLRLFGEGTAQGRLFTGILTLCVWGLSVAYCRKAAGAKGAFWAMALLGASLFALAQFTYTATYALCSLLLVSALYISFHPAPTSYRLGLAALFFTFSIGVRLSMIAALPIFLFYLWLIAERRQPAFWTVLFAALLGLGLVVGLYWLRSGQMMTYDILGFHLDRMLNLEWQLDRVEMRFAQTLVDFGALVILGGWGVVVGLRTWCKPSLPAEQRRLALALPCLGLMAAALFVAHLTPRTTDSYYNSLQAPLLCMAGAITLTQQTRRVGSALFLFLLLSLHILLQGRALLRDRLVAWPLEIQTRSIGQAAQILRQQLDAAAPLLTFNIHLALDAGLRVPNGYEMSIFAYRPTLGNEQAQRYRVINNEQLLNDLRSDIPAAAFTEFDLAMLYGERDRLLEALAENYRWLYTLPNFPPHGDELRLYFRPQFRPFTPRQPLDVTFEGGIRLLGFDLKQERSQDSDSVIRVALYWQAPPSKLTGSYTVFVQLLDSEGQYVTGQDNPPCQRTCPTDTWHAGEYLRDEYRLPSPPASKNSYASIYQVQAGLYDSATGQRLRVLGATGETSSDSVRLSEVTLR